MKSLPWLLLLVTVPVGAGQQVGILDFSASMTGFAGVRDSRTTGWLQRLGNTLQTAGPIRLLGLSAPAHKPTLTPLTINEAAARFANPHAFGGYSPLRWGVSTVINRYDPRDILLFTDGMEDDTRIEDVSNAFVGYAKAGWSVGFAVFTLPFDGLYYSELKIPFDDFRPRIEEEIHKNDPRSAVKAAKCTTASTSTCYWYTGPRPLLVVLLSRSGSVDRLFHTLEESAMELVMSTPLELVVYPPSDRTVLARAELSPESAELIRKPRSFDAGSGELECIGSSNQPLLVSLLISSAVQPRRPQATSINVVAVRVKNRPAWVRSVSTTLIKKPDGAAQNDVSIICQPPGLFESRAGSATLLKGNLQLEYEVALGSSTGWWTDISAPNSWQYPHRIYHLRDVVESLQHLAISAAPVSQFPLSISLKSRR